MSDTAALERALINAHDAGDEDGARVLAAALAQARNAKPKTTGLGAFGVGASNWSGWADEIAGGVVEGAARLHPSIRAGIGDALGRPDITPEQAGAAMRERIRGAEEPYKRAHPLAYGGGQIAGALPVALATGGGGPLAAEFNAARQGLPFVERFAANAVRAIPGGAGWGASTAAGEARGTLEDRAPAAAGGAAMGAVAGAAFGGAIPEAARALKGAGQLGYNMVTRGGMTPDQRAASMIGRRLGPGGLRPTDGPEQILDVGGRRLVGLADAVAQVDETPGSAIVDAARTAQRGQVQDWMLGQTTRATGRSGDDFYGTLDALNAQRRADARPLYEAANQTPVGPEDWRAIGGFLDRIPQAVQREAQGLARLEGTQPTPFQYLDYVRRAIGDRIGKTAPIDPRTGRPVPTSEGRALAQLKAEVDDFMNAISDQRSGGAWRQAREAYAGPSAQMDAMKAGRRMVLSERLDPEDIAGRVERMSDDQRDAFVAGVSRALADATERGQVTRFANNMRSNRRLQQRLIAALGPERVQALAAASRRAGQMLDNTNRITGNSATARRLRNVTNATEGEGMLQQLASDVAGGARFSALSRLAGSAYNRMARPGILNPDVSEALAQRLTAPADAENVARLLREIRAADLARRQAFALPPPAVPVGVPAVSAGAVAAASQRDARGRSR